MGEGIPSHLRTQWEQEIRKAESERMNDAAAMDILAALAKLPAQNQAQESSSEHSDVEEWIQMALDHERLQCVAYPICPSGN